MQFQGTLVLEKKYNKEGVHCFNLIALQFYGSLMFIYLSYIMCIHFHCKSPETDLLLNDFYAEVEKLMQVIIYESLQTVKSDRHKEYQINAGFRNIYSRYSDSIFDIFSVNILCIVHHQVMNLHQTLHNTLQYH